MIHLKLGLIAAALATNIAMADTMATTADGRKVVLHDDGRWSPVETSTDGAERHARLVLENKVDLANGCRLGLRLHNDLAAQVRTLVLRFTAYKGAGIPFETVSRGYSYIKPTATQYQEISFRGIACGEISAIEVAAARNCHVGELTKYSADEENCLKLVDVAASEVLPIAKASPPK